MDFVKIIVCILAGIGAGMGTGFAGMSAAAVISPMLIVFLNVEPYQAVGIALASDVLASLASAVTYGKNKNIDIKNGVFMMLSVLCFTVIGSFVSSLLPGTTMGNFSIIMTMLLGLRFIIKPITEAKKSFTESSEKQKLIKSIICGAAVGFICGFIGAGGGIMMLLVLTGILGYELKTAVGTSVFIMAFTALTGAVSHFAIGGIADIGILITCVISTVVFAMIAAAIANKVSNKILNRATGIVLLVLGVSMFVVNLI